MLQHDLPTPEQKLLLARQARRPKRCGHLYMRNAPKTFHAFVGEREERTTRQGAAEGIIVALSRRAGT